MRAFFRVFFVLFAFFSDFFCVFLVFFARFRWCFVRFPQLLPCFSQDLKVLRRGNTKIIHSFAPRFLPMDWNLNQAAQMDFYQGIASLPKALNRAALDCLCGQKPVMPLDSRVVCLTRSNRGDLLDFRRFQRILLALRDFARIGGLNFSGNAMRKRSHSRRFRQLSRQIADGEFPDHVA